MKLFTALLFFSFYAQAAQIEIFNMNVENLFDTQHDEGKNDYEFLPKSSELKKKCAEVKSSYYRSRCFATDWTDEVVDKKMDNIKALVMYGRTSLPDIVTVQEIENDRIAKRLAKKLGYNQVVMTESPDSRGIDVAVFYNKENLNLKATHAYDATNGGNSNKATRDILELRFDLGEGHTLNLYVNHWPSQGNPSSAREGVAKFFKKKVAARLKEANNHILAVGDFNTIPGDHPHPFKDVLFNKDVEGFTLWDIHNAYSKSNKIEKTAKAALPPGTYFYPTNMTWNLLDHFFVSQEMLDKDSKVQVDLASYQIHATPINAHDFVYKDPENFLYGTIIKGTPKKFDSRTGEGVADHFPVSVILKY
ncbi:MAG: endonuclease/exonuclease/phosphatase family protein [Halobacteriovoraceae bacterium]|nr:endonuclease/exonuclease/phosphatase family protein [Halobacteriovoraceae bacterium]